jgi:hypothetical protein
MTGVGSAGSARGICHSIPTFGGFVGLLMCLRVCVCVCVCVCVRARKGEGEWETMRDVGKREGEGGRERQGERELLIPAA